MASNRGQCFIIERLVENLILGEGPHWDEVTQTLYFVDIYGMSLHKYTPATKTHSKAALGYNHVSLIIPVEDKENTFLISIGRELATVVWDGIADVANPVTKILEVEAEKERNTNRFNDGKCDSTGRLWIGTMGAQPIPGQVEPYRGSLYSFWGPQKDLKTHLTQVGISNGLTWSADDQYLFFIDTHRNTVDRYEFDIVKASICNCRTVFTLDNHEITGALDGMTIDTEGNLWVAVYEGACVIKIDPEVPDTLLQKIDFPTEQVTSLTFGGKNLDELYVTSSALTKDGVEYPPPDNGALYVIKNTGSKGFPGISFKL